MSRKRKSKSKTNSSTGSDKDVSSPDEKKAKETSSSGSVFGSLTDETQDAAEMSQNLEAKVDKILNRIVEVDTKLERLDEIKSSVSNLEKKFDNLNDRVRHIEESSKEARVKVQQLDDGLTEVNTKVKEFKIANEQVQKDCDENCKARCKTLEDKLLYAEVYSRRENLRFYGISEEGEHENTLGLLKAFLENQLKVDASGIEFQRVHRVGKINEDGRPRPIIARFLRYGDREIIFSKAKSLKNTGFGMSPDLPREIVRRRKLQEKKMNEARKAGS